MGMLPYGSIPTKFFRWRRTPRQKKAFRNASLQSRDADPVGFLLPLQNASETRVLALTECVGADAHIGPRRMHRFYGNLRRIRNFQAGRCRHRPLQSRSFQASTDKMLCFQGMFSFRRKRPSFLNCCGTIENTGQTGFFGFTGDSSQIVVMQLPVAEKLFQE